MKIDFSGIEESVIPNFKGGLKRTALRIHSDELGKIMYGRLEEGASIGLHLHETSSEIIYIISGEAKVLYDGGTEYLKGGECHYCPKGHSHSLQNSGKGVLVFFSAVPEQ